MSHNCVFCDIIADRSPASYVASTPDTIAIIPLNPVIGGEGHVLVIPRAHVADFMENATVTATTMRDAAELARELRNTLGGDWNLITSAGADATQTVFHLHVHLVRRVAGDDLALPWTGQVKS
jgi:histidine triad (HIT) family protein